MLRPTVVGGTLIALALAAPVAAESPHPSLALDPEGGFGRMQSWFAGHPDLRDRPGSGWKPFQRMVWFAETRPVADGMRAGAIRRDAADAARARRRAAGGSGWFSIGPTQLSGRAVSLDFRPGDPDVVYVGSASGGLWRSTDGGNSWAPLTDDLPSLTIGAVCVLDAHPDVVLIGTGEGSGAALATIGANSPWVPTMGVGILKSTDAGDTWQTTSLSYPVSGTHGFHVIRDEPVSGVLLAGANDGLWRSTDEGDIWTEVRATGSYFDVEWKPGDAGRVYAARGRDPFLNVQTDNGIEVSTDAGQTFTLAGSGQPPGASIAKTRIAVTAADPAVVYAHYVNANGWGTLGIYRSTDDGATWQLRNGALNATGTQGWYDLALAVDPDDADEVVTGGIRLHRSTDGGLTFDTLLTTIGSPTIPHSDHHALVREPGSTDALWVATDGGVWRSPDDGATWESRREGIVTYQYYDVCVAQSDPQFAMGGTQDNGIPGRNGNTWFQTTLSTDGMVCNVTPGNADRVFAEYQLGNQVRSNNGGQSWVSIQGGLAPGGGIWVTPVDQDPLFPDRLYLGHTNGIWRTTNGGQLWTNVASQFARWISVNPADPSRVWTVSNFSAVWVTTDHGDTWTPAAGRPG